MSSFLSYEQALAELATLTSRGKLTLNELMTLANRVSVATQKGVKNYFGVRSCVLPINYVGGSFSSKAKGKT